MQAPNDPGTTQTQEKAKWPLLLGITLLLCAVLHNFLSIIFDYVAYPDGTEGLFTVVFELLFVAIYLGFAFAYTGLGEFYNSKFCLTVGVVEFCLLADLYLLGLVNGISLAFPYSNFIIGMLIKGIEGVAIALIFKTARPKFLYPAIGVWILLGFFINFFSGSVILANVIGITVYGAFIIACVLAFLRLRNGDFPAQTNTAMHPRQNDDTTPQMQGGMPPLGGGTPQI